MNTNQNTSGQSTQQNPGNFPNSEIQQAAIIGAADKKEDTIIIHDAKIITPHPYGVYGLCKIIEHLQNN